MLDVSTISNENIQDNLYTNLVLNDLRKAFDTVSHPILLSKLENYGIRGIVYNLICSYLKNQSQFENQTRS